MRKEELIEKYEHLNHDCFRRVDVSEVLGDLKKLDEPQLLKLKDVIARIKGFDLGTKAVWIDAILSELGSDYGTLKYKAGYEQGKLEGEWVGQQLKDADKIRQELNKPVVPQFVVDWYEENKDDFETNLFQLIESLGIAPCEEDDPIDFIGWLIDKDTKPFQTLVNMHQFGYTVEKEPKYTVKCKTTKQYLSNDELGPHFDPSFRSNFTKSDLEKLGLGWVFDCEGMEVEEVGK
nr:MAG TPA: Protein of unknown function (DUF1642) [Caudoviricetes sp.]